MNALNAVRALKAPPGGLPDAASAHRLAIYLNDHFAGSTVGLELAQRLAASNRDSGYAVALDSIERDIADDREALEDVMTALSVRKDRIKQAGSWLVEKLGRAKLNGQVLGYSPLSRLIELETLMLGVRGKQALWRVLQLTAERDPRLEYFDFERLVRRAEKQASRLEAMRLEAAEPAFME